MSDLPIAVSECVGGRARLPPLQVVVIMAKRRTEVKRKPFERARPESLRLMTIEMNDHQ